MRKGCCLRAGDEKKLRPRKCRERRVKLWAVKGVSFALGRKRFARRCAANPSDHSYQDVAE